MTFLTVAASVQISRYTACCWPTRTTELAQNSYFRNSGEWVPNPFFYAPLFPLDIFKGWSTFLEHCVSWQVFEMFPWPFSVPMALARVSWLKWWHLTILALNNYNFLPIPQKLKQQQWVFKIYRYHMKKKRIQQTVHLNKC